MPSNTLTISLSPIRAGWALRLADGRELARFRGPGARFRALRYIQTQLRSGQRSLGI
jgi:hypothetical protein